MAKARIEFHDQGFKDVLGSAGVGAVCASEARQFAAKLEASEGIPYDVKQKSSFRAGYNVTPKKPIPNRPALTHETWMTLIWPRVGGVNWRPHH